MSRFSFILLFAFISSSLFAQGRPAQKSVPKGKTLPPRVATAKKPTKQQDFVLQVIRSAVALSQPDPQDRLRVLASAANVASTISPRYAASLAKEGVELESFLVSNGQIPAVSIMASGRADCRTMKAFVDGLDPKLIVHAEQSLIGAVSKCPAQTLDSVQQKSEFALQQDIVAPRLMQALMEKSGASSPWTQEHFAKVFRSLPDPTSDAAKLSAPDYAAMYGGLAPHVRKDLVRTNGLKLLEWLGKISGSPQRSMAVTITASALKQALGKEKYAELLAGNVMARQVVEAPGPPADAMLTQEESASVLRAMGGKGTEQQEDLRNLPPSLRAREAAAHGFARGIAKDHDSAGSFFDMAFSAADEAWSQRASIKSAPGVIEEVSEAAAQVDALDALRRAQHLQDPTAQAIGMIAVARVVAGRDTR